MHSKRTVLLSIIYSTMLYSSNSLESDILSNYTDSSEFVKESNTTHLFFIARASNTTYSHENPTANTMLNLLDSSEEIRTTQLSDISIVSGTSNIFNTPLANKTLDLLDTSEKNNSTHLLFIGIANMTFNLLDMPKASSSGSSFDIPKLSSSASSFEIPKLSSSASSFDIPKPTSTSLIIDLLKASRGNGLSDFPESSRTMHSLDSQVMSSSNANKESPQALDVTTKLGLLRSLWGFKAQEALRQKVALYRRTKFETRDNLRKWFRRVRASILNTTNVVFGQLAKLKNEYMTMIELP